MPPINRVAYACYSAKQGTGPQGNGTRARRSPPYRLVMLVAMPGYAGLAVVDPSTCAGALGEKWIEESSRCCPHSLRWRNGDADACRSVFAAPMRAAFPASAEVTMLGSGVMPAGFLIVRNGSDGLCLGLVAEWRRDGATILLSRRRGCCNWRLSGQFCPPLVAALAMAGRGVALRWAPPAIRPWDGAGIACAGGRAPMGGALHLIAPDRWAEALRFAARSTRAKRASPQSDPSKSP